LPRDPLCTGTGRDALEVSVTERDVVPLLVGMWRLGRSLGESRKGVLYTQEWDLEGPAGVQAEGFACQWLRALATTEINPWYERKIRGVPARPSRSYGFPSPTHRETSLNISVVQWAVGDFTRRETSVRLRRGIPSDVHSLKGFP